MALGAIATSSKSVENASSKSLEQKSSKECFKLNNRRVECTLS